METFTKVGKKMGDKVSENPAALRAAVFLLSLKNRRGGGGVQTPPSRAKVNNLDSSVMTLCLVRLRLVSFVDCNRRLLLSPSVASLLIDFLSFAKAITIKVHWPWNHYAVYLPFNESAFNNRS